MIDCWKLPGDPTAGAQAGVDGQTAGAVTQTAGHHALLASGISQKTWGGQDRPNSFCRPLGAGVSVLVHGKA